MEFFGFGGADVTGDELDFSDLVCRRSLGGTDDVEVAPEELVDVAFVFRLQVGFAGVGVGGLDEVVDETEIVGAVSGAHEVLGGLWLGPAVVEEHAALVVAFVAAAGTGADFAFARDFFGGVHSGGVLRRGTGKSIVEPRMNANGKDLALGLVAGEDGDLEGVDVDGELVAATI